VSNTFFYLAKIAWLVAQPSNFLVLLGLLAALLLWTRWRPWAPSVVTGAALLLAVCAFSPLWQVVLQPLEDRFPPFTPTFAPEGIMVLGGGTDASVSAARNAPQLNKAAERLTIIRELAQHYPEAEIVYSGGVGLLFEDAQTSGASVAQSFLSRQGVTPSRLLFEHEARNTAEHPLKAQAIASVPPEGRWLLVTSASHMPRAMGVFRHAGWNVTAYPVDYATTGPLEFEAPSAGESLAKLDHGVKEWLGLLVYWMTRRTSALFPAP